MAGILATIIAARKRHYTFAWVIGIWTVIAITLAISGNADIAVTPGWLFLVIAIGMKKIPEESTNITPTNTPMTTPTSENTSTPTVPIGIPAERSVTPNVSMGPHERSAPTVIRFCRYCGQKLDSGAKFCRHCGARIE